MAREKLDDAAVAKRLEALPSWSRDGIFRVRKHTAPSVRRAVALIGRIADLAEGADHHPDLTWVWRHLTIKLSTHDAGGITTRDFHLAQCIEDVLADE